MNFPINDKGMISSECPKLLNLWPSSTLYKLLQQFVVVNITVRFISLLSVKECVNNKMITVFNETESGKVRVIY